MSIQPTPTALAHSAGISVPYASQLLSGVRPMARALALHIFRETGWRHASIADLTDEQIDVLQEVEPWVSRRAEQAA